MAPQPVRTAPPLGRPVSRRAFVGAASLALLASALAAPSGAHAGASAVGEAPADGDVPAGGKTPDYACAENWAYWDGGLVDDQGGTVADAARGASPRAASLAPADPPADLFIVAPTVALGEDGRANMDLANVEERAAFVGALNMQLGIYRDPCRVYAPFYRQATLAMYDVGVDPADYPPMLPIFDEGVYHVYDYQFFYRNLQENVAARIAAYLAGEAPGAGR